MNDLTLSNKMPGVIWLTGLSGAGKTTIADALMKAFKDKHIIPVLLDGDEIRQSLNQNGFDQSSRKKHNLSVGYLASLFEQQGHIVIVALISPYNEIRNEVRNLCTNFIEVFVSSPIDTCIQRDTKGLYKKAIAGEINDFTGISAPYFPPKNPEVLVDTSSLSVSECTNMVLNFYIKSLIKNTTI
jgi:adenylylsulfate kinase